MQYTLLDLGKKDAYIEVVGKKIIIELHQDQFYVWTYAGHLCPSETLLQWCLDSPEPIKVYNIGGIPGSPCELSLRGVSIPATCIS